MVQARHGKRSIAVPTGSSEIMTSRETIPIENSILVLRGRRVILAADLAKIYGVETRVLNQAVKRKSGEVSGGFYLSLDS
jgi:ORF6N domain